MIAYKAVIYDGVRLNSWTHMGRDSGIHYAVGAEARPPELCGPLACFRRLTDACFFIQKCGTPSRLYYSYPELLVRVEVIERSTARDLWTPRHRMTVELPEGTILVDRLKVLSVVEPRFTRFLYRNQYFAYMQDYETYREECGK